MSFEILFVNFTDKRPRIPSAQSPTRSAGAPFTQGGLSLRHTCRCAYPLFAQIYELLSAFTVCLHFLTMIGSGHCPQGPFV